MEHGRTLRLNTSVCYSTTTSPEQVPKLEGPQGLQWEGAIRGARGAAEERWIGKNRAAASLLFLGCFFFFFPTNEHGKATKPPQKHTFYLHSDPTPQLCTCCSHLHSKDKLTSARSPKLQQPGGPPKKRGRMGNGAPTQPPSAFQKQLGLPPGCASGWMPAPHSPRVLLLAALVCTYAKQIKNPFHLAGVWLQAH